MQEKRQSEETTNEVQLIRSVISEMKVPIDHGKFKRSFLQEAEMRLGASKSGWQRFIDGVSTPRYQISAAATYTFAFVLYLIFSTSHTPLTGAGQYGTQWNGLYSWYSAYRIHLGYKVDYPQGSELTLTDGTVIKCLDHSVLSMNYSPQLRNIQLTEGKIEINAAHDPLTPMVVAVADTRIKVTGTRFIVTAINTMRNDEL